MSARRKPPLTSPADLSHGAPTSSSRPAMSSTAAAPRQRRSPFLPTTLETALLSLYPATLLLGSLFSLLSPTLRSTQSVYSGTHQSYHPPHLAPSYFAQKKNVFNVYFVKKGWFWTTLGMLAFVLTHPSLGPPLKPVLTPRRLRLSIRWALMTAVWIGVTQWFFGPALIDRGFRFTGGQCELAASSAEVKAEMGMGDKRDFVTGAACKIAGGTWKGGHDISGHVFLLILGSAMLWMEVLPCVLRASGLRESRLIRLHDGKIASAATEAERENHGTGKREGDLVDEEQVASLGVKIALGVTSLSWWMLLMTAAFFHTWFEKFTGLLVAFFGLYVVYFLPRGVPALRAVVGMPGV